jgi:hypothetical protein
MSNVCISGTPWTAKELHAFRFLNIKRANGLNNSRDARRDLVHEYHTITYIEADKLVDKWLKNFKSIGEILSAISEDVYIESWVGLSCGQMESERRRQKALAPAEIVE